MKMTRSQSRRQGKGFRNFPEKLIESNEQQQLVNDQCYTAAHESDGTGRSLEGDVDRLLLLAGCAELAEQGSSNSTAEQKSQENVTNATVDGVQRSGFSDGVIRRPRLSQLRKQARRNALLLDKEESKNCQCHRLDGEAIRLSKKECIDTNNLSSQEMELLRNTIRLGHIKRLARLLGQSTRNNNKSEGNKKEKSVAMQTGKEVISQTTEGNHIEVASRKGSNPPEFETAATAAHNSLSEIHQPSPASGQSSEIFVTGKAKSFKSMWNFVWHGGSISDSQYRDKDEARNPKPSDAAV
ncbi:hypothetical protein L6164_027092 [Bauhinia variegata]|uniref:Uncharacterized protein n=1 Tax=Bauhinia variegata TaxID=167791 RepID=A0ACB9LT39_BAUVA|nr:hypothetical protein L6164_027092 [Bauhinia variegata]